MSAYLKFFELKQSPFEGKAQSKVVLGTRALRDAFAEIRDGLAEGSARICVNGGPGFGKTSLARSLPKLLGDSARVAVVLDPSIPWESLRGAIAKQWHLESEGLARAGLLEAASQTRLVLVVDRAEQATEDFLDHLDIMLSVRSETDEPAVQSVLLACLSTADGRQPPPLIWWLDRIQTLQLEFAPIPREGVESYIHKHLKRAGWRGERLFNEAAAFAIHGVTGGIPGEISRLCERLLAQAAEDGHREINAGFVHAALEDSCDENEQDDDREGAATTVEDNFEELVLEEEFAGATADADDGLCADASEYDPSIEPTVAEAFTAEAGAEAEADCGAPSLAQTLEHFEQEIELEQEVPTVGDPAAEPEQFEDADGLAAEMALDEEDDAEEEDEIDAADVDSLILLEEYLGAPASAEELQAIRRGVWTRHLRTAAAVAGAILIGAGALAWLGDGDDSSSQVANAKQPGESHTGPDGKVLARLRGPVTATDSAPPFPATSLAAKPTTPDPVAPIVAQALPPADAGLALAGRDSLDALGSDDDDLDETFGKDDFVDMRPASMRPDAASNSRAEERFW